MRRRFAKCPYIKCAQNQQLAVWLFSQPTILISCGLQVAHLDDRLAGMLETSAVFVILAIGAAQVRLIGRRTDLRSEVAAQDSRIVVEAAGDRTPLDFVLDCAGGDGAGPSIALAERLRRYSAMAFVGAVTSRAAFDTSALMRNGNGLVESFWSTWDRGRCALPVRRGFYRLVNFPR